MRRIFSNAFRRAWSETYRIQLTKLIDYEGPCDYRPPHHIIEYRFLSDEGTFYWRGRESRAILLDAVRQRPAQGPERLSAVHSAVRQKNPEYRSEVVPCGIPQAQRLEK